MAASIRTFCRRRIEGSIYTHTHTAKSWLRIAVQNKILKRSFILSNKFNSVRVRFAPSPTGLLHLGGLRTALYNFLFAKSHKGSFLLRIEDTDQTRFVPGSIDHIQEILQWTGIVPDEGPEQGGNYGPYLQSQRLHIYNENIKTLLDNGRAYPCFCSARRLELMRKEAARRGEPSKYDNRCRHLTGENIQEHLDKQTPFVIRLKLEPTPDPWDDLIKGPVSHDIFNIEGDPVLLKSDGYPTYHFANVVDDHFMGITHVLRGAEWLASTPKHILLYKAFGWTPPAFGHLPLIVNPDGSKLSKRQGDVDVKTMMEADHFPETVLAYVTSIGGGFASSTLGKSLQDMCEMFDLSLVRKQPSRLDPARLREAAIQTLHRKSHSEDSADTQALVKGLRKHLSKTAINNDRTEDGLQRHVHDSDYILNMIRWGLKDQRVSVLRDFVQPELIYLWRTPTQSQIQELVTMETNAAILLENCHGWLMERGEDKFTPEEMAADLKSFVAKETIPPKRFFHFMRKALTGEVQGPPVVEMLSVLGRSQVLHRLETALHAIRTEQLS